MSSDIEKERTYGPKAHRSIRASTVATALCPPAYAAMRPKHRFFAKRISYLLFEALCNMFEHDPSAARMEMNARR